MKPKKILLLGGSFFQIPSIEAVKRMGHYAITCDYRPDNPGHRLADEYHNVSTTDREGVLKLAQKLKIDAVVCYLSDPSAPTAAYVAEKLGLPGQPLEAVEILTHKDRFRAFLAAHGFRTPRAFGATSLDEARERLQELAFPVMVKPTDSCGSKGVTKLSDPTDLPSAVVAALEYSIEKRFIVEEFVEKDGYQIAGMVAWPSAALPTSISNRHPPSITSPSGKAGLTASQPPSTTASTRKSKGSSTAWDSGPGPTTSTSVSTPPAMWS